MDSFPADIEKFQKYVDTQIDLHVRKLIKDGFEEHFFTFKKGNVTYALVINTGDRLNLQGPIPMTKSLEGSKYQKMGSKSRFQDLIVKSDLFSVNHLVAELLKQKAENSKLNRELDEVEGENTHLKADLDEKIENEAELKSRLENLNKEVNTSGNENIALKNELLDMKNELLILRERYSLEVKEMENAHSGKLLTMRDEHERTMGRYFISFLKSDSSEVSKTVTMFLESSPETKFPALETKLPEISKPKQSKINKKESFGLFFCVVFIFIFYLLFK